MVPSDGSESSKPVQKKARTRSTKLPALEPFEAWDFESLRAPRSRSADYNEQRLAARRRVEAVAKHLVDRVKADVKLDVRTSIHNPFPPVNGGRVERLWAYATRPKAAKAKLRRTIGADLAKDLDQAYRNGYLCAALEADSVEVSFRIHQEGWFDGRNLVRRLESEGYGPFLALVNELEGFKLQLSDWKGEWLCGSLTTGRIEEFFKYYEPGEHLLAVQRRWPASEAVREAVMAPEVPPLLVDEMERLVPLYRYAMWSDESDHLFG